MPITDKAKKKSEDIATWLLSSRITLIQLSPREISLEPIRANSLILLTSEELILHLEFQTNPGADIPFRMLDCLVRSYRRFPDKQMNQVIIYIKPTASDLGYQNYFQRHRTSCFKNVTRRNKS